MEKIINVADSLRDAPRPIYLVGNAHYEVSEERHVLTATALFPSDVPSIEDRVRKHAIPHVNVGDAFFGVWNGIHIICDEKGYYGTLSSKGAYEALSPIPADEDIELDILVKNIQRLEQNRFSVKVDFEASYTLESRTLMRLHGQGYAIKK